MTKHIHVPVCLMVVLFLGILIGATMAPRTAHADPRWERVAGQTALDTMYKISNKGKSDFAGEAVIVATNKSYKDALAASSLAGLVQAPVVLTASDNLSAQTRKAIAESGAQDVIVVGGPLAVSENVCKQIEKMNVEVTRISGDNAVKTSVAIADVVCHVLAENKLSSNDCIIATAASFKDALSIAPYSYCNTAPIYLVSGKGASVSQEVLTQIKEAGHKRAIIVGGKLALSETAEKQLKADNLSVLRLAGDNGYQTSNKIAEWEIKNGMTVKHAGVATAKGYKDALAGAALCGLYSAPLLLVDDTNRYCAEKYVKTNRSSIESGWIFGGTAAVGQKSEDALNGKEVAKVPVLTAGASAAQSGKKASDSSRSASNNTAKTTSQNKKQTKANNSQSGVNNGDTRVVYITRTGTKYHRAGCRTLKSSYATTIGEAKANGYKPCGICNPPV